MYGNKIAKIPIIKDGIKWGLWNKKSYLSFNPKNLTPNDIAIRENNENDIQTLLD